MNHAYALCSTSYEVRACINETLRLFPPVPVDRRASTQSSVFPAKPGQKGIYMPGPEVTLSWWKLLVQTRPDIWGDDAAEFIPERWIDERLQRYTANPFAHVPFNAGPRICLGQQFAYNESVACLPPCYAVDLSGSSFLERVLLWSNFSKHSKALM